MVQKHKILLRSLIILTLHVLERYSTTSGMETGHFPKGKASKVIGFFGMLKVGVGGTGTDSFPISSGFSLI